MSDGIVPAFDLSGERRLSPTDVSQFIRLDQCQRYLRLRLTERIHGRRFLYDYDVTPQSIPPLLTRSGAEFEIRVEQQVAAVHPVRNLAVERGNRVGHDNVQIVDHARGMAPGTSLVLFQPRLEATLGRWRLRGDIDILRLERDRDGRLHVLIADMKSSTSAKVEHRLQVAFYLAMLETLLGEANVPVAAITMGVLYRGPNDPATLPTEKERAALARQIEEAARLLGVQDAALELVEEPEPYRRSVEDLVTDPHSTAERVLATPFDELPFHLTYKCDGCLYNEFCMKQAADSDDLSLLPHLTAEDKTALRRRGVTTVSEVAALKELVADSDDGPPRDLEVAEGKEALVRQLGVTWPVGPRLDELIHRARRYRRFKGERIPALSYIPSKGYGSLPYSDAEHNPNLVRIYIDAQHDYLHDRIYLLGALVVGSEQGVEPPERRRTVVHMTDGPPDTLDKERALFVRFARDLVRAVVSVAAPDKDGQANAPVHLIFFNSFEQRLLLDGLSRHLTSILEATPLYDFVTQLAAFDSPVLTYLDQEMRELKNYPMVCQSLQAVASFLKFDWNAPAPYRDLFRTRMFDYWGKFDEAPGGREEENRWYTGRARFNSQIPLEYAYAAWGELALPAPGEQDEFRPYRTATPDLLRGFHARRLEALECVAKDFKGNKQTEKRAFALPDLAQFEGKAQTLAQALDEFVTIERHTALAAWKTARLAPPERRVLAGDTLLLEYREEDQEPGVAEANREHLRLSALADQYRAASPDGTLTDTQRKETRWSHKGLRFRLRVSTEGADCSLEEALALTRLREGERVVMMPRTTVDTRPGAEGTPFTPTPKQLLYGSRADIAAVTVEREKSGAVTGAFVDLLMAGGSGSAARGFAFAGIERPLPVGERVTIDDDPNDWYGSFLLRVVEGLCAGQPNVMHERLADLGSARVAWDGAALEGQRRFLAGLDAFHAAGLFHELESSKREYIGGRGDAPVLLVQGPPGTGKSYATAFALFARLQGAMAAGHDYRVFLSCKTHAATNVLLTNVAEVQARLRGFQEARPELFAEFFDARLLDVPLYRLHREAPAEGIVQLRQKRDRQKGEPKDLDVIRGERWCVVGTAPGGVYRMLMDHGKGLFGLQFCDCLVLDEASQMNLPEAMMAALVLKQDAHLIVVGDHRQMPPIVKHDWSNEPRRTFQEFRTYDSLFRTLLELNVPLIQFAESFRLHADMAEFLRREVYVQDGIAYHSQREGTLPPCEHADPFVASVLRPEQTMVVVVHDEAQSILRNDFEQGLIAEVLRTLAAPPYGLDPEEGLGVVVPHRAQRAALQQDVPELTVVDPVTGQAVRSAVDTVERFQGDERRAIVVGATESDPQYLLLSSQFLLDPRRLTVALSRAKQKLIVVAARSVFSLFSADEETFANAQLWKNLLRRTCTVPLWEGERDGVRVQVWGNRREA